MTYRALFLALTMLLAPGSSRLVQVPSSPSRALVQVPSSPSRARVPPLARSLRPLDPVDPVGRAGYRWPVAGQPVVTRGFSPPPEPWLAGHRGVDVAGTPGEVIRAAGSGVVAFAGVVAGTGVVSVDHPGGLRTTYEPVAPLVHAGQAVVPGQPIGTLAGGHPGCPVAACLHWGLRRGAEYLDPLLLLHAARVRLYPA